MALTRARAGTQHPLMGARLGLLVRQLLTQGRVRPGDVPLTALLLASAGLRTPFRLMEKARIGRAHAPVTEDPVFIVGFWRTGTTHLHNLLSCSPEFGHISPLASGLPDEILTLGTWLAPWLEKALPVDRHVDRVAVRPDSPQEDEIPLASQQPLSIFQALYFPQAFTRLAEQGIFLEDCQPGQVERWGQLHRRFVDKIVAHQGKSRLLIKNPVYTARIRALRQIWPKARFIHIRRNPYEVYVSAVNYYRRMLAELALQDYSHVDIKGFVLDAYTRMMARFDEQSAALPADRLVEVSYESLTQSPLAVLSDIHERLQLPGWETTRTRVQDYLARVRGYQTNAAIPQPGDIERIRAAWGDHLDRWSYALPARMQQGAPRAAAVGV